MRYFRRLPPLLRVASILAVLFPLASMALLVALIILSLPTFPQLPVAFFRVLVIGANLGMLGGACVFATSAYSTRFRQPNRGPFLLDSWQSQVQAIALAGELFALADVGKHRAVVRAIVVDEGNGGDWFTGFGHSAHSLHLDVVNVYPRSLYAQIDRSG